MIQPGKALKLSPEDKEKLGKELSAIIMDLENYNKLRLLNYGTYWDWYAAKPLSKERNDPWEGASNLVVGIIRTTSDAVTARYFNAITAVGKMWMGRTENDEFDKFVDPVTGFLNLEARTRLELNEKLRDGINELVVQGRCVWGVRWEEESQTIFVPGTSRRQKVLIRRGPVIDHIPGDRILWDTNYRVYDAPVVVRTGFYTYPEMLRMAQLDYWDEEAVEVAKMRTIVNSNTPSVQAFALRRKALGAPITDIPEPYLPHDIREVYVDWPFLKTMKLQSIRDIDEENDQIPLVVTIHLESQTVLRVIGKPYFLAGNPYYDAYFRRMPGHADSPGMAEILEPIQRGITTQVNQSIDAVTFANSIMGVTTDPRLNKERTRPNRWLLVTGINDAKPFQLSKAIQPDMALINFLLAVGERLSGVSDPSLGREVRMGGHPAPATSTLALLQEGNKLFLMGLQEIRRAVSRLGVDLATLYQQFETNEDGRVTRAIGEGDARMVEAWLFPRDLPVFGNLELDLAALSETMNPEQARNTALMVDQVTTNYYARVFQFLQLMQNPQLGPVTHEAAKDAIEALGMSFRKILEMSDVDQIEKFTFDLEEATQRAQQLIARAQQLAASVPQQQGAGPPGVPPGGVPGPGMGGPEEAPGGPVPGANGGAPPGI